MVNETYGDKYQIGKNDSKPKIGFEPKFAKAKSAAYLPLVIWWTASLTLEKLPEPSSDLNL